MAYQDELLSQALRLINEDTSTPNQATLRRSVSTAYYATFHLLIAAAAANWNKVSLQPALGRAFEHGVMKEASKAVANPAQFPVDLENSASVAAVRFVARTFIQLQQQRQFADYDLTRELDHAEALAQVLSAQELFATWSKVRDEPIAQTYLVSLLIRRRT